MVKRIKKSKLLISLLIAIITVGIALIGTVVYKYLTMDINKMMQKINNKSDVVDEFKFIKGEDINLSLDDIEGKENIIKTSKPMISLKANGTTNEAKYNYYVYLNIESTITYKDEEKSPLLLLNVIDGTGREITNLKDLSYSTVNGVSGFDVTSFNGRITLADNLEIISNSSEEATIHAYTITITYLNSLEIEKTTETFRANVVISKGEIVA